MYMVPVVIYLRMDYYALLAIILTSVECFFKSFSGINVKYLIFLNLLQKKLSNSKQ